MRLVLPLSVLGATTGTVLGIWLSLIAVKHTEAGIAAALIAVTPLVVIAIGRVVHGERPGRVAIAGTLAAVAGAILLLR